MINVIVNGHLMLNDHLMMLLTLIGPLVWVVGVGVGVDDWVFRSLVLVLLIVGVPVVLFDSVDGHRDEFIVINESSMMLINDDPLIIINY